jgi:hypothetical protein
VVLPVPAPLAALDPVPAEPLLDMSLPDELPVAPVPDEPPVDEPVPEVLPPEEPRPDELPVDEPVPEEPLPVEPLPDEPLPEPMLPLVPPAPEVPDVPVDEPVPELPPDPLPLLAVEVLAASVEPVAASRLPQAVSDAAAITATALSWAIFRSVMVGPCRNASRLKKLMLRIPRSRPLGS